MENDDREERFNTFKKHFPSEIGQHIKNYVTDTLLRHSRYIFTKSTVSGKHACYCTHCKQQFLSDTLKHNAEAICPKCDSKCVVKSSGRGRKYLCDQAYLVYYEKSELNPEAIIARGFYVKRDYSGNYQNVETIYDIRALYLFEPGNSQRFSPLYWQPKKWGEFNVYSLYSEFSQWALVDCPYESIAEAIKGTPYQYSTWEHYHSRDMVRFFGLYSQYPCIEYLTKAGKRYFVDAKLYGGKTYGAINWNGKRIDQVLKLTKQQLREIKDAQMELHPLTLRLQQIVGKEKSNVPLSELQEIATKYKNSFEDIKRIVKYTTLRRTIAYANKQLSRDVAKGAGQRKFSMDLESVFIAWRDYISECLKLEMDMTQEQILFPKDLHEAHQKTSSMVVHRGDAILNAKILKRAKTLEKYSFVYGDIILRPALSSDELIQEGKALKHCVGGYSDKYGNGSTNIFVIRKSSDPNRPFFTMEVKSGRIIQTQGYKHCSPEGEVKEFVDMFKAERLDKKPTVAKRNSNQPQGVAV